MSNDSNASEKAKPLNFIEQRIEHDLETGKYGTRVQTRFPPEPNGYLHIGHAQAIWLNFTLANRNQGNTNLRFDDTNPTKEDVEYAESIKEDVRWLGFEWENLRHTSDYFEKLHGFAVKLIEEGKAYVDELTAEQMSEYRGVPTAPGKESPWRNRPVAESLDLFTRMTAGEFPNGKYTLRAKIDMASPNMHMRDPIIYRIITDAHHWRTGDTWKVYPMYDFAHGVSDAIEGITHSVCTLEFEVHRPLYEWLNDNIFGKREDLPQQIEFARLNLNYTVMSKRKLIQLVQEGHVAGWDDPRMPTISGLRRRGFTPESIKTFCEKAGVAKRNRVVEYGLLESCVRDHLNKVAERRMAVLDPLKVVVTNWPEDKVDWVEAINNHEDEAAGKRSVPFTRELYIERKDFMEDAPRRFFRLSVGREVRFRYGYYLTCTAAIKDADGNLVELHCTYDPESRGGRTEDGRKVKGTLHWVSATEGIDLEVRMYDRLFNDENPLGHEGRDFKEFINPNSMQVITAKGEPSLAEVEPGKRLQFERTGYFVADAKDHSANKPVFNRTATLRDTWGGKS